MLITLYRQYQVIRRFPILCYYSKKSTKKPSSNKSPKPLPKFCDDPDHSDLPKLPIPPLEQTLAKYEKTMKPLLTEASHQRLKQIIAEFGAKGGLGPRLQAYLENRREKEDNWSVKYWLNEMYFKVPLALPINSSPGMIFPPRKFTTILDVARFAARLIDATLVHKVMLDRRELPISKCATREPGQLMCMMQYYNILGTCRMPGKTHDFHYKPSKKSSQPAESTHEHIIVICRSQLYSVPLVAPDRGRLKEDEICSQLLYILDDAPLLSDTIPVGLMTGLPRPLWAEAREALSRDEKNRRILDIISASLMVICLDEPLPASFNARLQKGVKGHITGDRDETNLIHQMLHGGGSQNNTGNRWFDKTVQVIISGDGACGLCYEHSFSEAGSILDLVYEILTHADSFPAGSEFPEDCSHLPPPEKLEWSFEPDDQKRIEDATAFVDSKVVDLDFQVYRYTNYGSTFMKSCKCSPDVYCQLALQLAYYKLYGKLCATYESAGMRRFRHARVDCIRSASTDALNWVQAMALPKEDEKKVTFHLVSNEEKLTLWSLAVKQQTREMTENILGQGIDVHLLGLREAARETSPTASSPLPEMFTDSSYQIANKFLLTTSQIATAGDYFMGYGPVEQDGYGASYNPKKDHIIFCISAFWSSEITSSSKFAQSLEESLNAMQALLSRPS